MTRLERSVLSMPATDWRKFEKGLTSQADIALIDLEDSVAPLEKDAGRRNAIRALLELDWHGKPRTYRANGLETPFFYRDLIDVVEAAAERVDLIVIPKVSRAEDVYAADTLLTQVEKNKGLEVGRIHLEVLIESAEGLTNAETIASSSSRLEALIFGPGDFAASVGMPSAAIGAADEWDAIYPGHRFHYAMARTATAARAAGLRVIDGPIADFRDLEAVRRSSLVARSLGFDGKWVIHPAQIPVVNDVFSPTLEELSHAQKLVEAYDGALADGTGVVTVDGMMVDEASVRTARSLLESHAEGKP